jgi:hypothetical protein
MVTEENKKLANKVIKWYFDNFPNNINKIAASSQALPKEVWAELLLKAICSFNDGLEGRVEPEGRRASRPNIDETALRQISLMVTAAGIQKVIGI